MSNKSGHRARKRFGQNFLHDDNIIRRIVDSIGIEPADTIVEIGPGRGALTEQLLARASHLTAVELDRDLIPILGARFALADNFTLHQGDALKTDFNQFVSPNSRLRVVGNLPYNISTPLIFHLLEANQSIADMHFMLQKEVVQRICAEPDTNNYGRLSVMTQYYCECDYLFTVPPGAFRPVPKVDSAICRLTLRDKPAYAANDMGILEQVVTAAFGQRRKTLGNSLSKLVDRSTLESLGIDPGRRAQTLNNRSFVEIANWLSENGTGQQP